MYAFVRKHVERASVALLAGLIFAFTPAMVQRASVGHLDKISIFWLPRVPVVVGQGRSRRSVGRGPS